MEDKFLTEKWWEFKKNGWDIHFEYTREVLVSRVYAYSPKSDTKVFLGEYKNPQAPMKIGLGK